MHFTIKTVEFFNYMYMYQTVKSGLGLIRVTCKLKSRNQEIKARCFQSQTNMRKFHVSACTTLLQECKKTFMDLNHIVI